MKILLTLILAVAFCGAQSNCSGRIVGGQNATIADFPFQVALLKPDSFLCGGIIINKNWVLTAAHCLIFPVNVVHAGSSYYDHGISHKVEKTVIHSDFTFIRGQPINDIGLVQVSPEFAYSVTVRPAKLPRKYEAVDERSYVVVIGWGRLWENGPLSQTLQKVQVDVITNERCQMLYEERIIYPNNFCTIKEHGWINPCKGDSGGPALTTDGVVVGVVSWSHGCARVGSPCVFTKVSHYRDWITKITGV